MNKIRLVTLFSGYDSQALAMERLKRDYPDKFDYELVAWCEIDKAACMAHDALFPQWKDRNLGDISKVKAEDIPDCDCITWSFPCTDLSGAGKQAGMTKGSGTRSSLCWEAIRCFKAKRPKYLLMENVAALAQRRFIKDFHALQYELEQIGYTNFCAILDSAKFGIPQHRERLFMISIRDCDKSYHFPKPFKLEKRIKDILEPYGTVDESFYFKPEQLLKIVANCDKDKDSGIQVFGKINNSQDGVIVTEDSVSPCHCVGHGNMPKVAESALFNPMDDGTARTIKAQYKCVGPPNLARSDGFGASGVIEPALIQRLSLYGNNAQAGRVYDVEGIAPCLDTCSGGNRMPKILTPVRTEEAKELRRKSIEVFKHREFVPREDGISNTITTVTKDNLLQEPIAVAMRGRNPDNPSDRTKGAPTEQRLEFGDGIANCITTVQKDSMVAEPQPLSFANLPDKTVLQDEDGKGYLWQDGRLWRVRKLTGREVFRLMDVSDEDIEKIQSYPFKTYAEREKAISDATERGDKKELNRIKRESISKSAQYCLAGNSIVIQCLACIFENLFVPLQSRYNNSNQPTQLSLF